MQRNHATQNVEQAKGKPWLNMICIYVYPVIMHYLMLGCFTLYVSTVNIDPLPILFRLKIVWDQFSFKID